MSKRWQLKLANWWLVQASRRGWWALAATPLAWLYGLLGTRAQAKGLALRQALAVPVVVVGNVLVGGTGKTPIVAAVVAHLQAKGMRPGIVARGYKAANSNATAQQATLVDSKLAASAVGDEALLLHELTQVPVCVHPKRLLAAQHLLAQHPDINVIVSDDGLQHAALPRDLELVVFDERGVGNGLLMPAGLLREPWPARQGPKPATQCLVLQNGVNTASVAQGLSSNPVFISQRLLGDLKPLLTAGSQLQQPRYAVPSIASPVQVLAGIAKPHVFANMLNAAGFNVVRVGSAGDHDALDGLWPHDFGLSSDLPTICTEKDAVKLRARADAQDLNVWVAPLTVVLPQAFWQAFDQCFETRSAHQPTSPLSLRHG